MIHITHICLSCIFSYFFEKVTLLVNHSTTTKTVLFWALPKNQYSPLPLGIQWSTILVQGMMLFWGLAP